MDKATKERIKERLIGLASAGAVALASFWVGSFASDKELAETNTQLLLLKNEQKSYAKKSEVAQLKGQMDVVLKGLCIIDKRTCSLQIQPADQED